MEGAEVYALSALIIAILGGLGHFIQKTHLQKCKSGCCESDCRQGKVPQTPISEQPKEVVEPTIADIMRVLARLDTPATIAENSDMYELNTSV